MSNTHSQEMKALYNAEPVKQYSENSIVYWFTQIREWREQRLESVTVSMADLAITLDHVEDLVMESDASYELAARVKQLEAVCRDLVSKPKGVESHSYSDYKREYGE